MRSRNIPNAISSPESAAGRARLGSRAGTTQDRSGREAAPASRSARRESNTARPTCATCGPYGSGSSASAALQSYLENRLRRRLPTDGWTKQLMTWKARATPWQRPYCQLAVSQNRTGATGFTLWQTPTATNISGRSGESMERRRQWRLSIGRKTVPPGSLSEQAVQMGLWLTPRANESGEGQRTFLKRMGDRTEHCHSSLTAQAKALWATPTSRDHKDGRFSPNVPVNALLGRQVWNGSPDRTGNQGQLNPAFVCWLMGFPPEWESCAPTATPSSRNLRRSSSEPLDADRRPGATGRKGKEAKP